MMMDTLINSKERGKDMAHEIDWQVVYQELLPKVFHYFCYRIGDQSIAEDLTATTFEKAWRGRKRYRRDLGKFSNWVFGIASNVSIDYYRKNNHNLESSFDNLHHPSNTPSMEENLQKQYDFTNLAKLIQQLPQRQQELISLKYGANFNNRTIANLTGLSESNVGTILHRSVKKLRSEWEKN